MYKEHGKVLDIGCGNGFYLWRLRQLNGKLPAMICSTSFYKFLSSARTWETYGVEPNSIAADTAKVFNTDIYGGYLEDAKYLDNFFDAITMWHSLEHVYNPLDTLKEVTRILKDKGELIIGIPNVNSIEVSIFGRYWWAWEVPRHITHFSVKTISLCLEKVGLEIVKIEYSFSPNNIIMSLQRVFIVLFPIYKQIFKRVIDPDKNKLLWHLFFPVSLIFAIFKTSGRIVVYAQKDKNHKSKEKP